MFYVYCRSYYPVYEPAEGGYYVSASKVDECIEFNTLEDAYAEFIDSVVEAEKDGHALTHSTKGTRTITIAIVANGKSMGRGKPYPIFLCRARKL